MQQAFHQHPNEVCARSGSAKSTEHFDKKTSAKICVTIFFARCTLDNPRNVSSAKRHEIKTIKSANTTTTRCHIQQRTSALNMAGSMPAPSKNLYVYIYICRQVTALLHKHTKAQLWIALKINVSFEHIHLDRISPANPLANIINNAHTILSFEVFLKYEEYAFGQLQINFHQHVA